MKLTSLLKSIGLCIVLVTVTIACTKKPKVITASTEQQNADGSTGIFSEAPITLIPEERQGSIAEDIHTVTIVEVLPTVKYVYLKVKEGNEVFWIATNKMPVTIGGTYFYRGGLLKTNFESKEHNRVFDTMYLVSSLVESDHSHQINPGDSKTSPPVSSKEVEVKGSVKIADLVANPKKYAGKTIQISGRCVKVNPNIMGRNWVHLQDGSKDEYDLVITCDTQIPVGHTITMTGKVVLDKDFGAGYQYAILLEDGKLVQ
jgi:GW (Gly-Tryp) dipeptide domain